MPDLDEAAIRAAIDAGVRAALAALTEPQDVVVDEYPDYDEYGGEPVAETPVSIEVAEEPPPAPPQPSPLRARSRGHIPTPAAHAPAAPDGTGPVLAIGDTGATGFRTASGFMPDPFSNPDWFARNYQKDVLNQRRQPAVEDGIKVGG